MEIRGVDGEKFIQINELMMQLSFNARESAVVLLFCKLIQETQSPLPSAMLWLLKGISMYLLRWHQEGSMSDDEYIESLAMCEAVYSAVEKGVFEKISVKVEHGE